MTDFGNELITVTECHKGTSGETCSEIYHITQIHTIMKALTYGDDVHGETQNKHCDEVETSQITVVP